MNLEYCMKKSLDGKLKNSAKIIKNRGAAMKPDEKPVKIGDEMTLECLGHGNTGDGLFKKSGFIIFVPKTEKGRVYSVKITKVMQSFAIGEMIRLED